jgi:hypothetical protein
MDQNEIPQDSRHLVVPSSASKMIYEAVVRLVQTMHLSCVKSRTISKWYSLASTLASSPRSTIGCVQNNLWAYNTFDANRAPILHQDLHNLQTEWNEHPPEPRYLGVPSGVLKMISMPTVCWYKPCSYLALTPTISPNGLVVPWSSIGCVQNDFWAYGTFGANSAPNLRQGWHYFQTDWIELPLEPHHFGVPSNASKMTSEPLVCLAQNLHLSCTDTNTISKWTNTRFHKTHVT